MDALLQADRRSLWRFGLVGASAFALLLGLEIATEAHVSPLELLLETLELILTITAAGGLTLMVSRMQTQHEEQLGLLRDLGVARAEGEAFRAQVQTHLDGLGIAIDKQFQAWSLTDAERDVGLLMLKGLGHKEIAALRGTSEATVRQQARRVYQKSSLPGRPAFCAFFLEDLLPPAAERGERPAEPSIRQQ
jgi:DNA-binding CsgD family transcriptional regulator